MKGLQALDQVQEADYSKSIISGDEYDASGAEQLCVPDYLELEAADWLKAYKRIIRRDYDAYAVSEMLAASSNTTECIALALRYADQNPSDYMFKRACELAQTSTIGQLEYALYYVENREEYVSLVLALVHFDLFNGFELGRYVVRVEIVERDGKMWRSYINP